MRRIPYCSSGARSWTQAPSSAAADNSGQRFLGQEGRAASEGFSGPLEPRPPACPASRTRRPRRPRSSSVVTTGGAVDDLLARGMGRDDYVQWADAEYAAGRNPPIDFALYLGSNGLDTWQSAEPQAFRGTTRVLQGLAGRSLRREDRTGTARRATSVGSPLLPQLARLARTVSTASTCAE